LECLPARGRPADFGYDRELICEEDGLLRLKFIASEAEVSVKTVRRVDFHALRHTFNTILQRAGVPPRVIMELMRHSDLRLSSNTCTDKTCLPIFDEVGKLNALLPFPIASPNFYKTCQDEGKPVSTELESQHAEIVPFTVKGNVLGNAVPSWENSNLAEREGFEP
jgi:hypothetical protein